MDGFSVTIIVRDRTRALTRSFRSVAKSARAAREAIVKSFADLIPLPPAKAKPRTRQRKGAKKAQ